MAGRSTEAARRSCLTVPGSSERMLAKAASVRSDMVILDLEDAVAPSEKERARGDVAEAVRSLPWGRRVVGVRVNDWTSPWTVADVQAVVAGGGGRLEVIVLPKVEDAGMVRALDLVLTQAELAAGLLPGSIGIDAQIESAAGVQELRSICRSSARLEAIALGPLDLAASLGMPADAAEGRRRFDPIASAMVVAARAAGIRALDGPWVDIRDLDGLAADARLAAEAGFDGKWVLHPDQVAAVDEAFTPSVEALERAERILAVYESATGEAGRGAVLVDGEMIDEASCRIARALVARGRQAQDQEDG